MEEKKLTEKNEQSAQKLTYEQLNETCMQLYQQNQVLTKQLQQSNYTNMFKRLDYLFLVLKYAEVIDDYDFVNDCIDEIKDALIIPEDGKSAGDLKTN